MPTRSNIIPAASARTDDMRRVAGLGNPLVKLGRSLLLRALARIEHGELRLVQQGSEQVFGQRTERCPFSVTLQVHDPRFFSATAFGGGSGAGESYIRGDWSCDNLTQLVRLMVVNREVLTSLEGRSGLVVRPFLKLFHWLNRNSRQGSARNIAAHYDLSNELYRLMLDETMAYSCAIFADENTRLADASRAKFDAACRKLALTPSDHLLEIGTGWGGLALHAARHYGCKVTTTTISQAQHDYARDQIQAAGLQDRVTLLLQDYRDLRGQFDKLVSIEMIEAVGANYLETYFRCCDRLLAPDGAMLLQAITIQDQLYARALRSVDFIQRHVFPGSFIPSIQALASAVSRATNMKIFHLQDIGPHYARTLALWRQNFFDNIGAVRRLGFPDSFIRLWEFYLCYCEGGFAERQLGDVQILLTKPGCRRPALVSV